MYSVFMCFHKPLNHDDHQLYHSLNVSYAVVKISGLAKCWFWWELNTKSPECQNVSFKYFDRYTDLRYGISIEPKIQVLYIYRIPVRSPTALFTISFSDHSNIFISCDRPNELVNIMNNGMISVTDWLRANKLALNTDNTLLCCFVDNENTST